jgi:hypothetical protein
MKHSVTDYSSYANSLNCMPIYEYEGPAMLQNLGINGATRQKN